MSLLFQQKEEKATKKRLIRYLDTVEKIKLKMLLNKLCGKDKDEVSGKIIMEEFKKSEKTWPDFVQLIQESELGDKAVQMSTYLSTLNR